MSTEETAAKPKTFTINITRGGAYLLEGMLQNPAPATTPDKHVKASRFWLKLRKLNPTKIKLKDFENPVDFEKPLMRPDGMNDTDFTKMKIEFDAAIEAWNNEKLTVELRGWQQSMAKEYIEFTLSHGGDGKTKSLAINEHSLLLQTELGFGPSDE